MKQNRANNTLRFALLSMGFQPYTHIVVRAKQGNAFAPLGGSLNLSTVLGRYGDMEVIRSSIVDNVLFVDAKTAESRPHP